MEANELMIGDWVRFSETADWVQDLKGKPVQVEGLRDEDGAIKIIDTRPNSKFRDYWSDDENDFEPIPLTKEILEKNGFEELMSEGKGVAAMFGRKVEHTGVLMYCIPDTFDSISYVPERKLLRLKVMEGGITDLHNLQYVHELQHFLRLFGIEKEIVL